MATRRPSCRHSVSALLLPAIRRAGAELLQVELLRAVELLAGGHQAALLPLVLHLVELLATRPAWSCCARIAAELLHLVGRWAWLGPAALRAVKLLAGGHQVAELLPLVRY